MGYTDAQGRPEIVMNPSIKRGGATYRHVDTTATTPPNDDGDESTVPDTVTPQASN